MFKTISIAGIGLLGATALAGELPQAYSIDCTRLLSAQPGLSFSVELTEALKSPYRWGQAFNQNVELVRDVLEITRFKPMVGGLIALDHPWVTGLEPESLEPIWTKNIIFRTIAPVIQAEDTEARSPVSDSELVTRMGRFLANMVRKSARSDEYPQGMPEVSESGVTLRRMPHAVNYIHGSSHYNSGWLIFNNFKEAFYVFSDAQFRDELKRFAEQEKREIILIFRDTDYDPKEFADLAGFLRTVLPWYSNTNGPKDLVHWGSKAPFAVVNMITGNFKKDLESFEAKPPINPGRYFQNSEIQGTRIQASKVEKFFSWWITQRVRLRPKAKGNLFFVDKRQLDQRAKLRAHEVDAKAGSRRVERFLGNEINVQPLSFLGQSDRAHRMVDFPSDYDPRRDIIWAVKPDRTYHMYLVVDGVEFHNSVVFRKRTVMHQTDAKKLDALLYFRIRLDDERVAALKSELIELSNARSLTCVSGIWTTLDRGAGLRSNCRAPITLAPGAALRALLIHGLKDREGNTMKPDLFSASVEPLEVIYRKMLVQDAKAYTIVPPLGLMSGLFYGLTSDDPLLVFPR